MSYHQPHRKNAYEQISGVFTEYNEFTNLFDALHAQGYKEADISVLMSEQTHHKYFAPQENTKAPEGATLGGVSGGVLGALIGGLTLVGNLVIPGSGLLVAGPLVGALSMGALGAVTGGLLGSLIGLGIPEHEAKFFEDALKEHGHILVVVHAPKDRIHEVKKLFERFHALRLKVHACAVP